MRPTLALCCILKDEIKNLPQMLSSVKDCFDEIHLTDTGSTDGSIEWIQIQKRMYEETGVNACNAPIFLTHFEWCDDFSAARNFNMKDVKTDYVMWMDLDDVMSDTSRFIQWRDNEMMLCDFWLAPYNYAQDKNGIPVCTFIRERVVNNKKKFNWEYFIHEGMIAKEPVQSKMTNHWSIIHKRTDEDYKKDYERNVSMLEKRSKIEDLPTRLKFYYGKELHDKQRYQEAYVWLDQIVDRQDLEMHDRILTYEYLIRCCAHRFEIEGRKDQALLTKALSLCANALLLAPRRAELFCLKADIFVKLNKKFDAIPLYHAAKACSSKDKNPFLFINEAAYTYVPRDAISLLKFEMGDLDGAILEIKECVELYNAESSRNILKHLLETKEKIENHKNTIKVETDEIVFSCIPNSHPYEFDEDVYKERGIGGSETALVEVANHIGKITGKRVIVFNTRSQDKTYGNVEYRSSEKMFDYFCKFKPEAHFAWRHNIKLTDAPTYLWCHDLITPGAENYSVYDKIICLSDFHKNYVQCNQQIPDEKIVISRNGINHERFDLVDDKSFVVKNENKIVWPSSPDRGLERAIEIVKRARKETDRDLELHVYYGFENLRKYGQGEMADRLEKLMSENPWIKYHGNVEQRLLAKELMEAVVWLYPASFIETFCITVLECIYAKCYPIVREIGALRNTVKPFVDKDMATLLFKDAVTDEELDVWKDALIKVLNEKKWNKIDASMFDYSWEGVAQHFIEIANLEKPSLVKMNKSDYKENVMEI